MMDFDGSEMVQGFKDAFGKDIKDLTPEQVRWMVNVIKHCRGRCRNNSALYNYLKRNFTGHNFREVEVEGKDYNRLEITKK